MWSTANLSEGLLLLGAWVVGLGVVIWMAMWLTRRRRSETLALSTVRSIAGIVIGLSLIGLVFGTINQFIAQPTWLDDSTRAWVDDHLSALRSPTCDQDGSFPAGSPGDDGALSYCKGAINYLPLAPRLTLFIASVFTFIATVAVAWSVYTAALLASQKEAFHAAVHRTFTRAAVITAIAAIIANAVTSIGMTMAARTLSWMPDAEPPFFWSIPIWPFAVALGMFALSAIFRYGAVLQRETEGLV